MVSMSEKLETRNRYRRALVVIRETVCNLKTSHIGLDESRKAHVVQLPLSLDGQSQCKPIFFTPYRADIDNLEDPDHTESLESYPTYNPECENHVNVYGLCLYLSGHMDEIMLDYPPGIYSVPWGRLNFGALFEMLETGFYWKVHRTCSALTNFSSWPKSIEGDNEPLPHVKCLLENDAIGDDRLLRGELIAIIDIMNGRLNTKSLRPHTVAPVMVFSGVGPQHLRVLEAYFDGENLIIRKTKLYDMREYDAPTIELLARWWFGYAGGETRSTK